MTKLIRGSWKLVVLEGDVYARRILRVGRAIMVDYFALDALPPGAPAREILREILKRFVLAIPA